MSVLIVGVSYFVKPDIFKLSEQVTTIKEAVEKQERKVDDLNKDIRDMLNDALQRTYPDKGTSPAKSEATTRGALNDARNIIALAAKTGVLLSPESLTKVGSKALADADERPSLKPLAWQVASEALTLASRVRNPAIFRQQLPECQPPTNFEVEFEGGGSPNVILKRTVLERCAFTLDLPPGEQKFVIAKEVVFKGCLIRYSGGDVRLEGSLVFEDCVFQFGVTNEPPPIGRRLAGTLLASQLTRAETRKP